jgi:hypothetical protein
MGLRTFVAFIADRGSGASPMIAGGLPVKVAALSILALARTEVQKNETHSL